MLVETEKIYQEEIKENTGIVNLSNHVIFPSDHVITYL